MDNKEKNGSNRVINYIQDFIKKIAFNAQKRKSESAVLNSEKEKFIYFHKNLRKTFLSVSLEEVHNYYDYGESLSNEDKIDILINYPELSQYLKDSEADKKLLFKTVVVELISKNNDKELYFKLKKNNSSIKDFLLTKEHFKIEWISFLDEKDLFLFSEEVLEKIGDIKKNPKDVFILLGKNINIVSFIEYCLKEAVNKGYIRHNTLPIIYKESFGSKIQDVNNVNLNNIIKAFLKTEDILNEKNGVNKTFASVYLTDTIVYNLKDTKEVCLERLEVMLKNDVTDEDCNNNNLSYVKNPLELLKRNVKFLKLFNFYTFKEDEENIFNYLKEIKNDEMMYVFFTKIINHTKSSLLSKENLDIVIAYRDKNRNNQHYSSLEKTITDYDDLKRISGFENYYEMFKYFMENKIIDINARSNSIRTFLYFSKLEKNYDFKLKIKYLYLFKVNNNINFLKKDELLGFIFNDLDEIKKDNENYNNIKNNLLKFSFITESVIKEWEDKVVAKKYLTISDIKETLKSKTFKEPESFTFLEQMLSLGIVSDLNLNDEDDLSLVIKSLKVNHSIFEEKKSDLVSNQKFINMYFKAVSKSEFSIGSLIIDKFDKSLLNVKHISEALEGFNNDVWILKDFKKAPCLDSKEFSDFIKNNVLKKGLNLGYIKIVPELNKIITKDFCIEALDTVAGRYSLISNNELDSSFVKEHWDKLFETCKDENYPYFQSKQRFLCKYLNMFNSGKHEMVKELLKNTYHFGEDFFLNSINKSIDNIITVIDVAVEENCVDSLFKSESKFQGVNNLFDSFFFNREFADFMDKKYGIKESYSILNKTSKDIEKILLDYERLVMKSDIEDVEIKQVEPEMIKAVRKTIKVKKF